MSDPLFGLSTTPVDGPPFSASCVFNVDSNQGNSGPTGPDCTNNGSTMTNPQDNADMVGAFGDFSIDGSGCVGGPDSPNDQTDSAGGSGSNTSGICMNAYQLNTWIYYWYHFDVHYCSTCVPPNAPPPDNSGPQISGPDMLMTDGA